jgi:hypothetical protein
MGYRRGPDLDLVERELAHQATKEREQRMRRSVAVPYALLAVALTAFWLLVILLFLGPLS